MTYRTHVRLLLPTLLSLAACRSSSEVQSSELRDMVSEGRFEEAVREASRRYEAAPNDSRAEENFRQVTIAYLLEAGRRLTFEDRDKEALEVYKRILDLDPEQPQARVWHEKTRLKLADTWSTLALELHAEDYLLGAREAYERCLTYDPGNPDAQKGIYGVDVQIHYREGLSVDYYNDGLEALRDVQLFIAASRFDYAGKYREDDAKSERRVREVNRELSKTFSDRGDGLVAEGFFAAARTEYRMAVQLDEANTVARTGLESMMVEAEAHELLKAGKMWVLREEFDKAEEDLESGLALTAMQQAEFEEVLASIDEARVAGIYTNALNLERDFRLEDALAVYHKLLGLREYYQDARTRASSLEETIAQVRELYDEQLPKAATDEERLTLLRSIDLLWPEYLDVQDRIDALAVEGQDD